MPNHPIWSTPQSQTHYFPYPKSPTTDNSYWRSPLQPRAQKNHSQEKILKNSPFPALPPSLGLEWKLTFSSPVATAEFSKFAGTLSVALGNSAGPAGAPNPSSFRIWNSSSGIPSPPLALFVVMLPKAHLTSHSRMSGSRWVITPLWLSGSWRSFFV